MKRLALGVLACLALALPSYAHDFYTGLVNSKQENCCGGNDCREITQDLVRGSAVTGFQILNFMRTDGVNEWLIVPEENILIDVDPPDGKMHACIFSGVVRCLILPRAL